MEEEANISSAGSANTAVKIEIPTLFGDSLCRGTKTVWPENGDFSTMRGNADLYIKSPETKTVSGRFLLVITLVGMVFLPPAAQSDLFPLAPEK